MENQKRILSVEEINKLTTNFVNEHFLSSSSVKEWTVFIVEAMTTGVTEFEIDQYALTEEDFSKKYY